MTFAEAVTPSDTDTLAGYSHYGSASKIYVGVAGDVSIETNGAPVVFVGLSAGEWHPMPSFSRVNATGTTATDIVVGY